MVQAGPLHVAQSRNPRAESAKRTDYTQSPEMQKTEQSNDRLVLLANP
jgi:hypothetical protein